MSKNLNIWIEGTIIAALATVLSLVPFNIGPSFSVTVGAPVMMLYCLRRGLIPGFFASFLWGVLHTLIGTAYILTPLQGFIEYFIAFGFTGLAGLYTQKVQQAIADQNHKALVWQVTLGTIVGTVGRYFWRVTGSNPRGGAGVWSEPRSFEQRPPPPVVDAPEIGRHQVTLRWSAASGGPYRVQLARDAGFERIVSDVVSATPEATVMKPFPGTYHVRVQVLAADGQADPFGPARRVAVPLPPWLPVLLFSAVLVVAW